MLYVYEFEIYKSNKYYLALPFVLDGATQGTSFNDACEMAAEWLKTEIETRLMHGVDIPGSTFDHEPENGGKVVIVAVSASLEEVPKVTASKAAEMLGVTRGRVSQMCAKAQLESFKDGGIVWVTLDSIKSRIAERPHAGRPKSLVTVQ